jgi:hypothetical protein
MDIIKGAMDKVASRKLPPPRPAYGWPLERLL